MTIVAPVSRAGKSSKSSTPAPVAADNSRRAMAMTILFVVREATGDSEVTTSGTSCHIPAAVHAHRHNDAVDLRARRVSGSCCSMAVSSASPLPRRRCVSSEMICIVLTRYR